MMMITIIVTPFVWLSPEFHMISLRDLLKLEPRDVMITIIVASSALPRVPNATFDMYIEER